MKLKLTFLALFVFVVAGPIHGQYLHPKVTGKQTQIRNVVMLPAKVEVVRQSMKGPEGMAAESDLLSTRVSQLVSEALATKHITVLAAPTAGAAEGDAQQKYKVADIQARYDALLPKIEKKRKDAKKGRFRSEEHTSELQSHSDLVCRLLLEKKNQKMYVNTGVTPKSHGAGWH